MSVIMIYHPGATLKRKKAARATTHRYERMKGPYRINLWDVEYGKQMKHQFHLDFIPVGKVTQERTGKRRWLKMRNGKMQEVIPHGS